MKSILKTLASALIVYHLLVIFSAPMTWSVWGRTLSPYLSDYSNLLGVNVLWQFFSPLPSPTMYLHYNLVEKEGAVGEERETEGYWPPRDRKGFWRENWNRRSYSMRYMAGTEERLQDPFATWLCRRHPRTDLIEITHYLFVPPNMERMRSGHSFKDLGDLRTIRQLEWTCAEGKGEN